MKFNVEAASARRVILVSGNEDMLRTDVLRQLMHLSGMGEDDFDSEIIIADAQPIASWIASVGTTPFLADRRTLVVRNLLRADPDPPDETTGKKSKDKVPNPLLGVPASGRLILVVDDETSDKKASHARILTTWRKFLQEVDGEELLCEVKAENLASAFIALAKEHGKKLTPPATTLLIEMVGGSYSRGMSEVQKLAIYVGDSPEIREEHVRYTVTPTREWNMWALLDAVRERKMGEAVKQLRIISGSNKKMNEVGIASITPQLTRYFRLLWQTRVCLDRGANPNQVPADIKALFPAKPNIADEKAGTMTRIIPQARRVTLDQIAQCFSEVNLADARLKGQEAAYTAEDTMERLMLRLSEILAPAK